jgi:hypothetical protein
MNKKTSFTSKKPAPNSIGTSHQILKNQIGTLKGMYGTIGGEPKNKPAV